MAGKRVSTVRDAAWAAIGAMIVATVAIFLCIYKVYWALLVVCVGVTTFLLVLRYHPSRFYRRVVWACIWLISIFASIPGLRAAGVLGEDSGFEVIVESVGTIGLLGLCVLGVVAVIVCAVMEYLQRERETGVVKISDKGEKKSEVRAPKVEQYLERAERSPSVGYAERVAMYFGTEERQVREAELEEPKTKVEKKATVEWPNESLPLGGPKVSEPFAGRKEELEELTSAMGGKKTVVAVVGMAGQGKSCLVGEWYKRGARPGKGVGLFWRKVYEAGYMFDRFVDELYMYLTGEEIDRQEINTVEARTAVVEGILKERACWIVLDEVERWLNRWAAEPDAGVEGLTVDDRSGQEAVFDKFLKSACFFENGSRLILTTRAVPSALDENPPVMIGENHGQERRLAGLKEEEAVELLEELGVRGEKTVMQDAARAYGCHPYAVHVLGVLIRDLYGGDARK